MVHSVLTMRSGILPFGQTVKHNAIHSRNESAPGACTTSSDTIPPVDLILAKACSYVPVGNGAGDPIGDGTFITSPLASIDELSLILLTD